MPGGAEQGPGQGTAHPYPELEQRIAALKSVGSPLAEERRNTPLLTVIARIGNLPSSLDGIDVSRKSVIEQEVRECERILAELSCDYVPQIITRPRASRIFRILRNADRCKQRLAGLAGQTVTLPDGRQIAVTDEVLQALTRYSFSIGSPPVTPLGIETIEEIVLGGSMAEIARYRDLLGCDPAHLDRLLGILGRMIDQSTRYTTARECAAFLDEATDLVGFEGARGLLKTVVTGDPIWLIRARLLSRHGDDRSAPYRLVDGTHSLADPEFLEQLISDMNDNKEKLFVVRVSGIPHRTFSGEMLLQRWRGVIGRLILVDTSVNACKTGVFLVYSLQPAVIDALQTFQIKEYGTPSNTQLNLRLLLEQIPAGVLGEILSGLDRLIDRLHAETADCPLAEQCNRRWQAEAAADHRMLCQLRQLLQLVQAIGLAPDTQAVASLGGQLASEVAELAGQYFYSGLEDKGYRVIPVPQGGGRRELALIARFLHLRIEARRRQLVSDLLPELMDRLDRMKEELGISEHDSQTSDAAVRLAVAGREDPNQPLIAADRPRRQLGRVVRQGLHRALSRAEQTLDRMSGIEETLTGLNLPGVLHQGVVRCLQRLQLEPGAKHLERSGSATADRLWTRPLDWLHRHLGLAGVRSTVSATRKHLEPVSIALAEAMLHALESGTWAPILALPEVGWTFDDVFVDDDFPAKRFLTLSLDGEGRPDPLSLQRHLEAIRDRLAPFPELFRFYCASICLVVNDPHNPTARVADPQTKLALLQLASDYNLTVVADEAYHKLVSEEVKQRQGDPPLAAFYERHRRRFSNPVTIFTCLPSTKWALGGGRRTGVILSNDHSRVDGIGLAELVSSSSQPGNLLSLYLDLQTLQVGLAVKALCRQLEPRLVSAVIGSVAGRERAVDRLLDQLPGPDRTDPRRPFMNHLAPLHRILAEARNQVVRLSMREAGELALRRLFSRLVSDLKGYRLEKLTRRDIARRSAAVEQALLRAGFEGRFLTPEGPFYVCVRLAPEYDDPILMPFLETMAARRLIDAVPVGKGWIRFSFGGRLDGSDAGYELLGLALETDLRLLLGYWQRYLELRRDLNQAGDPDPATHALQRLFRDDADDLPRLLQEKAPLVEAMLPHQLARPPVSMMPFRPGELELLSKIEPGSPATVVTVPDSACRSTQELLQSRAFTVIYHYLISRAAPTIAELRHLDRNELLGRFGAEYCRARFDDRRFEEKELSLFRQLLQRAAELWFAAATIKVLLVSSATGTVAQQGDTVLGTETRVRRFVLELLRAFLTPQQEQAIPIRACFQAGLVLRAGTACSSEHPGWLCRMLSGVSLVSQLVPTDESPDLVTGGTRRAGGYRYGIFRRDGDGHSAPEPQHFRSRLEYLAEIMRPSDYLARLLQVGPTRILVILHRAYSHYLGEELRLFPQIPLAELLQTAGDEPSLRADGVALLGTPRKVMGESYRIGYFLEQCSDGRTLPVSWVSAGDDTDYMGYFKKPILTLHNEIVHARGGLPVHGALLTITLRNGLRKTVVLAGDSGTGKSELLIAMTQQMIDQSGAARHIESIELLAGDMLSLFIGEDGQLYAFGTESGDFLRMTDIPESWQHTFRDRIATASTTNRHDSKNPRTTVGGLCKDRSLLAPTRVNLFFVMNNYLSAPPGGRSLVEEVEEPENLLLQIYPEGWRREKGTSGDQPNLRASLLSSDHEQRQRLAEQYQEQLDRLLGWQTPEPGEPAQLCYQDVPDGISIARDMVHDLFVGRGFRVGTEPLALRDADGVVVSLPPGSSWRVGDSRFDVVANRFSLQLLAVATGDDGEEAELAATGGKETLAVASGEEPAGTAAPAKLRARLDRHLFDSLLPPIAATFCGNPFVDPRGMGPTLRRFAQAMAAAEVITGVVYTQLAVPGQEREGPARASQHLVELIQEDPRINARFQRNKARVYTALQETYGQAILGPVDLPVEIQAVNLLELERFESDAIRLVDRHGKQIDVQTPYYRFSPAAAIEPRSYRPRLLHPEIEQAIRQICASPDFELNLQGYDPNLAAYEAIRAFGSEEELLYQVMLVHGDITLGHGPEHLYTAPATVRKAQHVARLLRQQRTQANVTPYVLKPSEEEEHPVAVKP